MVRDHWSFVTAGGCTQLPDGESSPCLMYPLLYADTTSTRVLQIAIHQCGYTGRRTCEALETRGPSLTRRCNFGMSSHRMAFCNESVVVVWQMTCPLRELKYVFISNNETYWFPHFSREVDIDFNHLFINISFKSIYFYLNRQNRIIYIGISQWLFFLP